MEHVGCGRQSAAGAVDQQGSAQFRLESAGSVIVGGFVVIVLGDVVIVITVEFVEPTGLGVDQFTPPSSL